MQSSNITLSDKQIELIEPAIKLVDQVFVELRKDIPQTRYVIEVMDEPVWDGNDFRQIPSELLGYWIQEFADDNTTVSLKDRLGLSVNSFYRCNFVKAIKKEVTVTQWDVAESVGDKVIEINALP